MSQIITARPDDPLAPWFEDAVERGEACAFCGGPLSLPCVFHRFIRGAAEIFLHPACALELTVFLAADVKAVMCATNAHAALRGPVPTSLHPEAC